MKIAVMGYSGSGKSTLARALGDYYGVPVLHLDRVQFLPGWKTREQEEKLRIVQAFMDDNEGWIIDGNYTRLLHERRLEEADVLVLMLFNRFSSLCRVIGRYRRFRGRRRPDMADGCAEKLDGEFIRWVLWKGRGKTQRRHFAGIERKYPEKCVILRNQRQLDAYIKKERES